MALNTEYDIEEAFRAIEDEADSFNDEKSRRT